MKNYISRRSLLYVAGVGALTFTLLSLLRKEADSGELVPASSVQGTDGNNASSDTGSSSAAETKPKATILFNFGNLGYDGSGDVLKEYGWTGTFHTGGVRSWEMQSQVKQLVEEGHDIGIQYGGYENAPAEACMEGGYDLWKAFIQQEVDELKKLGLYLPTQYNCSVGRASVDIVNACKDLGFRYVLCGYVLSSGTSWDDGVVDEWCSTQSNSPDKMTLGFYSTSSKEFEEIKDSIDDAVENHYVIPLFFNGINDDPKSYETSAEIFLQICDYVKELEQAGKVEVLNSREFYEKYHPEQGAKDDRTRIMSAIVNNIS